MLSLNNSDLLQLIITEAGNRWIEGRISFKLSHATERKRSSTVSLTLDRKDE